ncbi:unnamed protein product [Blepharisma stoltei]|uniref:Uncharacterized protein n=1 Tax=Blepharisma stoltei TaxID=1481888 RepID=A0AAU9IUT3_9CILI|nr:unnamed protein product [Blepharisma stoltei]
MEYFLNHPVVREYLEPFTIKDWKRILLGLILQGINSANTQNLDSKEAQKQKNIANNGLLKEDNNPKVDTKVKTNKENCQSLSFTGAAKDEIIKETPRFKNGPENPEILNTQNKSKEVNLSQGHHSSSSERDRSHTTKKPNVNGSDSCHSQRHKKKSPEHSARKTSRSTSLQIQNKSESKTPTSSHVPHLIETNFDRSLSVFDEYLNIQKQIDALDLFNKDQDKTFSTFTPKYSKANNFDKKSTKKQEDGDIMNIADSFLNGPFMSTFVKNSTMRLSTDKAGHKTETARIKPVKAKDPAEPKYLSSNYYYARRKSNPGCTQNRQPAA